MKSSRIGWFVLLAIPVTVCVVLVGCNGKGEAPKREYRLNVSPNTLMYTSPLIAYVCDDVLICMYMPKPEVGGSLFVATNIDTGEQVGRRLVPFRTRPRLMSSGIIVLVPREGESPGGDVLAVPDLRPLADMIDIMPGFPVPSSQYGEFGVERTRDNGVEDIYMYSVRGADPKVLRGEAHGLGEIRSRMADGRLIVSGQRGASKGDGWHEGYGKSQLVTQLWSVPSMKKVREYAGATRREAGNTVRPVVLGETFAFKTNRGKWSVCDLKTGKSKYTIGRKVAEDEWIGLGVEVIELIPGSRYVNESERVVAVENTATSKQTRIVTYDANAGTMVDETAFPREEYLGCWVRKAGDRWVVVVRTWDDVCVMAVSDLSKKLNVIRVPIIEKRAETAGGGRFVSITDDMRVAVYGLLDED